MTRIYYPITILSPTIILEGQSAHHVLTVLRRKLGDMLTLFDGKNKEYQTSIIRMDKKQLELAILQENTISRESPLKIHLIQGISKGERMDWVVQKATELGVSRISPIITQHGAVSLKGDRSHKKQEHWGNIIINACEQCGRNKLPELDPIQSFSDLLLTPPVENITRWILHPNDSFGSKNSQSHLTHIQLLIGPEGGFSTTEVLQAHQAGFCSLLLGPRILRTETAAIAAISALQAIYGDGLQ